MEVARIVNSLIMQKSFWLIVDWIKRSISILEKSPIIHLPKTFPRPPSDSWTLIRLRRRRAPGSGCALALHFVLPHLFQLDHQQQLSTSIHRFVCNVRACPAADNAVVVVWSLSLATAFVRWMRKCTFSTKRIACNRMPSSSMALPQCYLAEGRGEESDYKRFLKFLRNDHILLPGRR